MVYLKVRFSDPEEEANQTAIINNTKFQDSTAINAYNENVQTKDSLLSLGLDNIVIIKRKSTDQLVLNLEKSIGYIILGATFQQYGKNIIVVVEDRIDNKLDKILMHEFGHTLLGQNHNTSTPSIMHPSIAQATPYISKDDIKLFCNINGC